MPYYKTLLHYGEIVSDYENEKDNIRVTIFLYNDEKYRVVKYKGIVQSIVKFIYEKIKKVLDKSIKVCYNNYRK